MPDLPSPLPARRWPRLAVLAGLLCAALGAQAQALSCSNDGQAAPTALLERFMDADCSDCWIDPRAPLPARGALVIDWVRPSGVGDDAAMSAVALTEAQDRLQALGLNGDAPSTQHLGRSASGARLRVVQGFVVAGHLGAKLRYRPATAQPYTAWLLLVEQLPPGTEGSPVARQLVRAAAELRPGTRGGRPLPLDETRAFRVPEGAQPERLRVLGWVQDARGRLQALGQTHC